MGFPAFLVSEMTAKQLSLQENADVGYRSYSSSILQATVKSKKML